MSKFCYVALAGDVPVATGNSPDAAFQAAYASLAGVYDPAWGSVQIDVEVLQQPSSALADISRFLRDHPPGESWLLLCGLCRCTLH